MSVRKLRRRGRHYVGSRQVLVRPRTHAISWSLVLLQQLLLLQHSLLLFDLEPLQCLLLLLHPSLDVLPCFEQLLVSSLLHGLGSLLEGRGPALAVSLLELSQLERST